MPALRCAFWIGHSWLFRGRARQPRLVRSRRAVARARAVTSRSAAMSSSGSCRITSPGLTSRRPGRATEIASIGVRFGDAGPGRSSGVMEQGHALGATGPRTGRRATDRRDDGRGDREELSPIVAGIVYCNTISFCHSLYQLRRMREWTRPDAMVRRQPEMVAHKGLPRAPCRDQILMRGSWRGRAGPAHRVGERTPQRDAEPTRPRGRRVLRGRGVPVAGRAHGCRRSVSNGEMLGSEPQPGMALLRLAQGSWRRGC